MRLLIGQWWASNLYNQEELEAAFRAAGFPSVIFRQFPLSATHSSVWGHVVEAKA